METDMETAAAAATEATATGTAATEAPTGSAAERAARAALVRAVLAVMSEVSGIEKTMTVGHGQGAYRGVSDRDVKRELGRAMARHGLALLPVGIDPTVTVERWEEGGRARQQVFTEVRTRHLLLHEGGGSMEIAGYGHGVDPQDKGAGKATTYALKNALLYAFLVPTGAIDDADARHSDGYAVPTGLPPSLPGVVNGCGDRAALNTVWRNNPPLHENAAFVRMVGLRFIALARTAEEVDRVFEWRPALRADERCARAAEKRKKELERDAA